MVFRIEKDTIHAEEHIDFLKQIMRQHPHRKIIFNDDNFSMRMLPHNLLKKVNMFLCMDGILFYSKNHSSGRAYCRSYTQTTFIPSNFYLWSLSFWRPCFSNNRN